MKKYIEEYIKEVELKIAKKKRFSEKDKLEFKDKIIYFQHERLIHLLVTLFFVLFTCIFLALGMVSYLFLIPFGIGIIFLVFYIIHYFFLENSVQYMYRLYDKMFK